MTNRILSVTVRDRSPAPAEAELHITVVPERLDEGTEVRGRLMGPRCRFAETIEVAYHLRPLRAGSGGAGMTLRSVVPEASFWEPQTPHLYSGPVELWQDGQRVEVVPIRHGFRRVAFGPRGLKLNGQALLLRGRSAASLSDESALALRASEYNLVVGSAEFLEIADRIGLFVLLWGEPGSENAGAGHPSYLGWLTPERGAIAGSDGMMPFQVARGTVGNGTSGADARPGLVLGGDLADEGESHFGAVET